MEEELRGRADAGEEGAERERRRGGRVMQKNGGRL